jgi:dGTPase
MSLHRERAEQRERQILSPHACYAAASRGRPSPEPEDPVRTCFQRDRDRVLHCKSFRRLAQKTQVFFSPEGDHYRTRITHTLEMAQIARTISRALGLNEDLTEAIAMGHDLGHTPFGHAGEAALNRLVPGGFHHVQQSLRVVDVLEREGRGLNLTHEVRDGIAKHSKGRGKILGGAQAQLAMTLEGQVVRVSDIIAYVNHDLDDAIRARLLQPQDIPEPIRVSFGLTPSERIANLIGDVLAATDLEKEPRLRMSERGEEALLSLREFLYERVYDNPRVHLELVKAEGILAALWNRFVHEQPETFRRDHWPAGVDENQPLERAVTDTLAGMSDRYAIRLYESLFLPQSWPLF